MATKKWNRSRTPEYYSWANMIQRCTNPNYESYPYYGGRNVGVCKRWRVYENFLEDMGKRPKGTTLDRINNNGNYTPSNCRWATLEEQANNKRPPVKKNNMVVFRGKKMPLQEVCKITGARYSLASARLYRGWSLKEALYT